MKRSAPSPPQSPFEAIPRYIATSSILSFVTSNDWLHFRLASRACFEIVHGTTDVSLARCPICQGHDYNGTSTYNQTGSTRNTTSGSVGEESESLWRLALIRDYMFDEADDENLLHQSFHSPVDPQSDAFLSTNDIFTASNLFISWKHWRKIDLRLHRRSPRGQCIPPSEKIVGPYFLRAGSMWQKIEQWCDDENRSGTLGQEIKSSLEPGRPLDPNSHGRFQNIKTSALKAVYAFYAGQCDPSVMAVDVHPHHFNPFTGLFGGFQAYHIISSTRWMEPEFGEDDDQPFVIIAQSDMKVTVIDLHSGQVYFLSDAQGNQKLLATPNAGEINRRTIIGGIQEEITNSLDSKDSILRWFEEHANRLHHNIYSVGTIMSHDETLYSLLRYPTLADTVNCSRAVTRGVEIVTSAIFVPEMEVFVYSIRIRLLTSEDGEGYLPPEVRGFDTCQLLARHWRISKYSPNSNVPLVDEVRGEGVIGLYPLLREGGYTNYEGGGDAQHQGGHCRGYFSYQSLTDSDLPGFLEGSLQFRPGSLAEPSGEVFDVRVAPFPLKYSQFLY